MANFGWSYPAGCNSVPGDEEVRFNPKCERCHGEGVYERDTIIINIHGVECETAVQYDCDCWEEDWEEDWELERLIEDGQNNLDITALS